MRRVTCNAPVHVFTITEPRETLMVQEELKRKLKGNLALLRITGQLGTTY